MPGRAPAAVRRRAEPRRPAALAPDARDRGRKIQAALAAALIGASHLFGVHRRWGARGAPTRARGAAARRIGPWLTPYDFHRQAQGRPPLAAAQCAGIHPPRLRGGALDPVRGPPTGSGGGVSRPWAPAVGAT